MPSSARRAPRAKVAAWSITAVILAVVDASSDRLRQHGVRREVSDRRGLVQYLAVAGAIAASLYAISRGLIIEPPAVAVQRRRRRQRMVRAPRRRDRGVDAMTGTLARYFGMRFLSTLVAVLFGVFVLIILLDYVELMRRLSDVPNVSALLVAKTSLYRVPQIAERMLPFCVLIGAMSCYLGLSRRLELVVSRAAGMSAWQFTAPAVVVALLVGVIATTVYNPMAAILQRTVQAPGGGNFRQRPRGPAGDREWLLGEPAQRQRPVDHQRREQPRAGCSAEQRHRLRVRSEQPFPRADRGQDRRARIRPLAARRRARLCAGSAAERTRLPICWPPI